MRREAFKSRRQPHDGGGHSEKMRSELCQRVTAAVQHPKMSMNQTTNNENDQVQKLQITIYNLPGLICRKD